MNFTTAHINQDLLGSWHASCQFWDADGVSYTWAKDGFEDHVAARVWIDDLKSASSERDAARAEFARIESEAAFAWRWLKGLAKDTVGQGAERSHGETAGRLVADGSAAAAASRGSAERLPNDEVFVDHVAGLENALSFIRDTASANPESTDTIYLAAQAALCQWWDHKDTRESISVYAARMARQRDEALHQREIARRSRDDAENHAATAESENTHLSRERDVAVNALKQIVAEFDDADQDPVLHLARAALRQIAEPWMRADQSVKLP